MKKSLKAFLAIVALQVVFLYQVGFGSGISNINQLTDLGGGKYKIDFAGSKYQGYVTADGAVLNRLWYVAYDFTISNVSWPTSSSSPMGNVKAGRFWNPKDTPVNFVIELNADRDGAKWVVEGISLPVGTNKWVEGSGLQVGYFFSNFKSQLTQNVKHKWEIEYGQSTAINRDDGYVKIWLDGVLICDNSGFRTRKDADLQRPFIVGWSNVPEGNGGTFNMEKPIMAEGKTRAQYLGSTPPAPQPTVAPPVPQPPVPLPTVSGTTNPVPVPSPTPDFLTFARFKEFVLGMLKAVTDFITGFFN